MGLTRTSPCLYESHCNYDSFCKYEGGIRYRRASYSPCHDMASGARPASPRYGPTRDFVTSLFHASLVSLDSRRRYR